MSNFSLLVHPLTALVRFVLVLVVVVIVTRVKQSQPLVLGLSLGFINIALIVPYDKNKSELY